jgi:hypothetical protein
MENSIFKKLEAEIVDTINKPDRVNGNDELTRVHQLDYMWFYSGQIYMAQKTNVITCAQGEYLTQMINNCSNDSSYRVL